MREIKFRYRIVYYNKPEEVITYYFTLEHLESGVLLNFEPFKIISKDQYTGLKDKNEKDEYEGDILQIVWLKEPYTETIVFKDGSFVAGDFRLGEEKRGDTTFEIIGNIYKNPELIK